MALDAIADGPAGAARGTAVRPIRILHVVKGMERGGLETWLMGVMRRIDRRRFHFDFCTGLDRACAYDDEIRALGGEIIPCLWNGSLRRFHRLFRAILRERPYDVVHSHARNFSGFVLRVAHHCRVPQRIAHLHTDSDGRPPTLTRRLYRGVSGWLTRRHATLILGGTRGAIESFAGPNWRRDPRLRVVRYGIDLAAFEAPADADGVRRELGVDASARLLIHVGRFVEAKNHLGLVECFRELCRRRGDLALLLVGSRGECQEAVKRRVSEYGLGGRVFFLGAREDLARLLKSSDVFVLPSVREGMPLVMLEATAAGLPVVASDLPGTREANEECCLARLVRPDAPATVWADAVQEALSEPRPDPAERLARVAASPFSSDASARVMMEIYGGSGR